MLHRDTPIRVVFVCLGNICRSPMAEAIFRHMVKEAALDGKIESDSAGTGPWHVGNRPHPGTLEMLRRNGISTEHRGRLITLQDLRDADYIVVMDRHNMRDVRAMGPARAKLVSLLQYAQHRGETDVPDPYFDGGFARVYDLVAEGCAGLLAAIRREHSL